MIEDDEMGEVRSSACGDAGRASRDGGQYPGSDASLGDPKPRPAYPRGGKKAYIVWGTALIAYVFAGTCRSSLSAMGIATAEHFGASSVTLSLFVYLQLFVYGLMQAPVGLMLDRFGSRRMLTIGVLLMSFGQLLMGFSPALWLAVVGRGVVGLGDSMIFVSAIRLIPVWFDLRKAPLLNQLTSITGGIGQLISLYPFVWLFHLTNWQAAFATLVVAGVLIAVAVLSNVQDHNVVMPQVHGLERLSLARSRSRSGERTTHRHAVMEHLKEALASPGTLCGFWVHSMTWFPLNTMNQLWGVPFLLVVEGWSAGQASAYLAVGMVIGILWALLVGRNAGRHPIHGRAAMVYTTVAVQVLCWTAVLFIPGPHPMWLMIVLLLAISSGGPTSNVAFDFVRDTNDPRILGAATGVANTGGFLSAALALLGVGVLLQIQGASNPAHYTADVMRRAFMVQYPVWLIGLIGFTIMLPKTVRSMRRHLDMYEVEV